MWCVSPSVSFWVLRLRFLAGPVYLLSDFVQVSILLHTGPGFAGLPGEPTGKALALSLTAPLGNEPDWNVELKGNYKSFLKRELNSNLREEYLNVKGHLVMNQLWSGAGLRHVRHVALPVEADIGLPTLFLTLPSIPMKSVTCRLLGSSETLSEGWWGHNCFHNGTETLFSFLLCWYLIWWQNRWRTKSWVPEHCQGWAPNSTYSDGVLHCHPFTYKSQHHLRITLMRQ